MSCFESYMEFREEVEKIRINQKMRQDLPERQKRDAPRDPPLPD